MRWGNSAKTAQAKVAAVRWYHAHRAMVVLPSHPVLSATVWSLRKLTGDGQPRPGIFLPSILAGWAAARAAGPAERATWRGILLSFYMLLRAEHMWAYADGLVSPDAGILVGDVAFQWRGKDVPLAAVRLGARVDAAFVTLRGSKTDQTRRGEVVPLLEGDGGPGDPVQVLAACVCALPPAAGEDHPLTTVAAPGGGTRTIKRAEATAMIRRLARYQATPADAVRFNTHAMRVGGATSLAHAGVPADDIKRAGRWRSNAYLVYIRANMADFKRVQAALRQSARKGPQLVPAPQPRAAAGRRTW
jgi:hypothetical protein